jgi:hypothetical protein
MKVTLHHDARNRLLARDARRFCRNYMWRGNRVRKATPGQTGRLPHLHRVVLTTALFVTLGKSSTQAVGDPSRVVTGIVTGVDFLGAGVIFSQGGRAQGITTAALIWALAAIGVTIGFGYPQFFPPI